MINLEKQAVKGATVHFRCGGSAVIMSIAKTNRDSFRLKFCEYKCEYFYKVGGRFSDSQDMIDIVRIDPPEFDWSTVQKGWAFKTGINNKIVYFLTSDPASHDYFIGVNHYGGDLDYYRKEICTRAPEHDKTEWRGKVKKNETV